MQLMNDFPGFGCRLVLDLGNDRVERVDESFAACNVIREAQIGGVRVNPRVFMLSDSLSVRVQTRHSRTYLDGPHACVRSSEYRFFAALGATAGCYFTQILW